MNATEILSIKDPKELHRQVANALGERVHKPWFEFHGRQACIERAMAKPLPGASASAFTTGAIEAGGHIVRRVVPTHFAVLQALKSPLLAMIEQASKEAAASIDLDPDQQIEICHVFTADPKDLRATLKASGGVDAIRAQAQNACGEWGAAEINFVILAIIEQLKRHVETTVRFAADLEAKGDVSFFLEPKPRPEKPAGSGGS
jgi:hypothetical protein